jgi:hypothetical protein
MSSSERQVLGKADYIEARLSAVGPPDTGRQFLIHCEQNGRVRELLAANHISYARMWLVGRSASGS